MKLIVFGSTQGTCSAVLQLGTEDKDLEVTAFVHGRNTIPTDVQSKLTKIISGDVLRPSDVTSALHGHDVVISCLESNPSKGESTLLSDGTENIVNGMRKHGIRKLALVGTAALLPRTANIFFSKPITTEHERVMKFLRKAKDVDWTIAMLPRVVKATEVGNYKTSINKLPGSLRVTTYDAADWLLSCVQDDEEMKENAHQLIGISSNAVYENLLARYKLIILGLIIFFVVLVLFFTIMK